jgi:hypothetical protein
VPTVTNQGCFPKTDFQIDLATLTCTCPAPQVTGDFHPARRGGGTFRFAAAVCGACPLRVHCVRGRGGRTVAVHPQEALLQAARRLQRSPAFRDYRSRRQVVEHRLARLVQLGIRQARYFGRRKTLFQLMLAAAVANLTLLAATSSHGGAARTALCALGWAALLAIGALSQPSGRSGLRTPAFHPFAMPSVTKMAV